MSYVVLARKYRPMFFEDVVGQRHVTQTLQNAIEQNRIANAYLFSGPRGVGKTTVARLLAKALNCEKGPTTHPCNECSSCIDINESRSLDVLEIDGASNRGIDEVRNLREGLRYSPNPGKHRIYIIDEVHMLTNEAFNALLKTLEEPPKDVLFIFATTEPHKVPATILSRCQRFDFKRITNKEIIEQLEDICKKEGIQIDAESLRLISTKADGGMRDAESILDQLIAFSGKDIKASDVETLLGIINQELFFRVSDLIKTGDVQGGLVLANQIFVEGYDFSEFLTGLSEHFRNFLVAKTTGSSDELNVSEEHARRYLAESADFEIEDLLRLIKIASDTDTLIRRSSNARVHLEVAIVKMIKLSKSVQLSQLIEKFEELKKKPDNLSVPSTAAPAANNFRSKRLFEKPRPLATPSPNNKADQDILEQSAPTTQSQDSKVSITLQQIEDRWQEILEAVKRKKIALGSFLSDGWPTRLEGRTLEVTFGAHNGFHINSVQRNREIIHEIIHQLLGVRLSIKCRKDNEGILEKVRKAPAHAVDKKKEFEKLLKENKIVRSIVDMFDAELIKY